MTPDVLTALPAATVAPVTSAEVFLAQSQPGGEGADFGKSSPVGLLLLLVFLIAVVFLVRSMTKHLKRVPASFDGEGDRAGDGDPADDTDTAGATDSTDTADSTDTTADGAPGGAGGPVGGAEEAAATGRE
ncbi:hypothetical protein [Saccharomonospora iraqiensis]|uniref:hypothetical protein n=1 Tax=Saccharomonospora iraqiensis TaxID=52698 RepID=UPI00022E389B|nr:hypothetical protein [Saccharomonospora iraqiensis]